MIGRTCSTSCGTATQANCENDHSLTAHRPLSWRRAVSEALARLYSHPCPQRIPSQEPAARSDRFGGGSFPAELRCPAFHECLCRFTEIPARQERGVPRGDIRRPAVTRGPRSASSTSLTPCTTSGGLSAISPASCRAAASTASWSGYTSLTRPIRSALAASMSLPVNASSRRCPSPMIPASRCRLPRSATIATFTSRTLNLALRAGQADIRGADQVNTAANAPAGHGGDHRLTALGDSAHRVLQTARRCQGTGCAGSASASPASSGPLWHHRGQVEPVGEVLPASGEHDRPDLGVGDPARRRSVGNSRQKSGPMALPLPGPSKVTSATCAEHATRSDTRPLRPLIPLSPSMVSMPEVPVPEVSAIPIILSSSRLASSAPVTLVTPRSDLTGPSASDQPAAWSTDFTLRGHIGRTWFTQSCSNRLRLC